MPENSSKLQLRRETDGSPWLREYGWYHSFEFPDGSSIRGVQTIGQLQKRWNRFPIPSDLTGRRILDIGAWDGWFSFEAERRGATVVSVDCVEIPNLLSARKRLGSNIDYRVTDLYKLPSLQLGVFDYVFFLGVLYHVKHPLLALQIVCALTTEVAIVESAIIDGPQYEAGRREEIPTLEFYETTELGGHFDNWFAPSVSCLMAMCRSVGFAYVELLSVSATTASVACYRRWPDVAEISPTEEAPDLAAVVNNANLGINVSTDADDYLSWWFTCDGPLIRQELQLEVGGFACHAVSLTKREGKVWSANTIVPPGLPKGWADARMRTIRSPYSRAHTVAVDIPPRLTGPLLIDALQDAGTWESNRIRSESTHIILWVSGLCEVADRANIAVYWDDSRLLIDFVGDADVNGTRQINARVPLERWGNRASIVVRYAREQSNTIEIALDD